MADIFIGYAKKDRSRVKPLAKQLETQGWSVWWDSKIPTGQTWADVIERELNRAKCVVVVWSQASVGNGWVKKEARRGLKRGILMPVMIENVEIPLEFEDVQAADLIDWGGNLPHSGVDDLLDGISTLLGPRNEAVPESSPTAGRERTPHRREKPTPLEGMVLVPKGPFQYGDERNLCPLNYDYYIDIYPVTNEQYKKFIKAGGYTKQEHWSEEGWKWREKKKVTQPYYWDDPDVGEPDHPVVGVSWYEAEAYAKSVGKRLPTEKEWEKAARGTDGRIYPWGDEFDKEKCNSGVSGIGRTTPVTKYVNGLSPYGCYDMAGNVWEWTSSDVGSSTKVVRGGSWLGYAGWLRSSYRFGGTPDARTSIWGSVVPRTPDDSLYPLSLFPVLLTV